MTKLRILVTVDPYIPVPPLQYGGIERVVAFVVNGLVERGHEVTLMAHPASQCSATLVGYGVPPHFTRYARARELWQVGSKLLLETRKLDAVLSWGRLAALSPVLALRGLAKLQCYQRNGVPWRSVAVATILAGPSIRFAGCSSSVYREGRQRGKHGGRWSTIFNGVEICKYQFVAAIPRDAPLCFLGRLEEIKGVHHAITIARQSRRRLLIAGNQVEEGSNRGYFERAIAPHIDGDQIKYVGPVDDAQKNDLLGRCAAFLMPIEWDEPFGIVMAEAMACGTPVIAFDRGSVPEVVRDGINGFRCRSVEEAVAAVGDLDRVDRVAVRADCEARFGSNPIVEAYESLLVGLVRQCRGD